MAKVTYIPRENGDPISTHMIGICDGGAADFAFRAGEPVEIPDDAYILQLVRIESVNAEGLPRGIGKEQKVALIDILAANPYFSVEKNGQHIGEILPPKRGRPATPKTAQEYRAYAQAWIAATTNHSVLQNRWADEAALREKLDVHDDGDDVRFLQPFYEAKYHALKKITA
jgi:hypothetical protein